MKLTIDTDLRTLEVNNSGNEKIIDLFSKEAFDLISHEWLRIGWNQKYQYTFTWMGRPVIQLPEDMIRLQEVIYQIQPDVIIETGIAHGGSLIYYSSLCKALDKGRIIGIDIEIRPHNRIAIESHSLFDRISLIEGSSIDSNIVSKVKSMIKPGETVLVILDSNHSYQHVYQELSAYSGFVTSGSYIVATDGVMKDLSDVPRGSREWKSDNPYAAALDFVEKNPTFVIEQPAWIFNESCLDKNISHWPGAWIKKL